MPAPLSFKLNTGRGRRKNRNRVQWQTRAIVYALDRELVNIAEQQNRTVSSILQEAVLFYLQENGHAPDERLAMPDHPRTSKIVRLRSLECLAKRNNNFFRTMADIATLKREIVADILRDTWGKHSKPIDPDTLPVAFINATIAQLRSLSGYMGAVQRAGFNARRTETASVLKLWDNFKLTPLHRYPKELWDYVATVPRNLEKPDASLLNHMPEVLAPMVDPLLQETDPQKVALTREADTDADAPIVSVL